MVRIWLALRTLVESQPVEHVRFWGKILGTERNYVVAEIQWREGEGDDDEMEVSGVEKSLQITINQAQSEYEHSLTFAFALCCHSSATRAPIGNPPNDAQLGCIPYHFSKLHLDPFSSVGMQPQTDRHTDTDARDHYAFCVVYGSREM